MLTGKEYRIARAARRGHACTHFPLATVHSAMPQAHLFRTQAELGTFQHDAAHVLFGEEIGTGVTGNYSGRPTCRKKKESLRQPAKKR